MPRFEKFKNNKYVLKLNAHVESFRKRDKKLQIIIILAFLLIIFGIPSAFAYIKMNQPAEEMVTVKEIEESTPTPTPEEDLTPTKAIYYSPTITKPAVSSKTPTPTLGSSNNPTSAPTQTKDTTAPTLDFMTGPADGSTVDSASFCFPMKASDNVTRADSIQTRFRFDSASFGDWGNNLAPCFYSVSNGSHNFVFEFRDEAGNVGSAVNRTFTVQVN